MRDAWVPWEGCPGPKVAVRRLGWDQRPCSVGPWRCALPAAHPRGCLVTRQPSSRGDWERLAACHPGGVCRGPGDAERPSPQFAPRQDRRAGTGYRAAQRGTAQPGCDGAQRPGAQHASRSGARFVKCFLIQQRNIINFASG